jgi:hypothetical protein
MKYLLTDVTRHCIDKPRLWTAITADMQLSADFRHLETSVPIPGLKPFDPVEDWPHLARWLARSRHRQKEDIGLGDTATHLMGDENSDRFQNGFKRLLGHDYGCASRKAWLNSHYRYPTDQSPSPLQPLVTHPAAPL